MEDVRSGLDALQGWGLTKNGTAISKRFTFKNFKEAWSFVEKVGVLAEAENHHPDITFGWGYAEILFTTHAIGGLHANDFIMARMVDNIT